MAREKFDLQSSASWSEIERIVQAAARWYEHNRQRLVDECPSGYAVIAGDAELYATGVTEEEAETKFRRKYPEVREAAHFRIDPK